MKIKNLLLSTLVLSCSFAQGQATDPTESEARKAIKDTLTATTENTNKINGYNSSTVSSIWTATVNVGVYKVAQLSVTRSDDGTITSPFIVRGIDYSPAPMNTSNKDGPAFGDWYWDTLVNPANPSQVWAYAWESLWRRDLQKLRDLGINCIRVYSMLYKQIDENGHVPTQAEYDNPNRPKFPHRKFLDLCWNNGNNPIYVLVGIPMKPVLYQLGSNIADEQYYWEHVLVDTARDVGTHPAVLGFTVGNEVDLGGYAWDAANPNSPKVQFWWQQLQKYAQMVKAVAPNKLVGIAFFDNPDLVRLSGSYMNQCTSIDFWGVNTFQPETFNTVFGNQHHPGYSLLTGVALKPVLLTEWGIPATGHRGPNDPLSIYSDTTTETKTADVVAKVFPNAFAQPLCAGVYYFEYCDEWWKQDGTPNKHTWFGGAAASEFPNGYYDEAGFGVYSIERAGYNGQNPDVRALKAYFHWDAPLFYTGPYQPDVLTKRTPIADAIRKMYNTFR